MTFVALWALFGIDIKTSSDCPSLGQVTGQLQALAFDRQEGDHGDVRVDEVASGVRITWLNADGSPSFSKLVPAPSDCEGKARAAAVVIAAHRSEIPSISLAPVSVAQTQSHRQEPSEGNRFHFGAGAGPAIGKGTTMAALLEFGIYHPAHLIGFSSRLRASLPNDVAVGAGEATYAHFIPSLVLRERHGKKAFAFDLHQEVALVITRAAGRGFDKNYSATTTVPAVGGGTKVEYLLGEHYSVWCDVTWLMALGNDNLLGSDAFGSDVSKGLARQHWWAAIGIGGML